LSELLISGLKKEFPDHKFIGEEAIGSLNSKVNAEKYQLTLAMKWFLCIKIR
jgi:fructose-1,6-bisphosphatase/inositol monophosphatase family enzyme